MYYLYTKSLTHNIKTCFNIHFKITCIIFFKLYLKVKPLSIYLLSLFSLYVFLLDGQLIIVYQHSERIFNVQNCYSEEAEGVFACRRECHYGE